MTGRVLSAVVVGIGLPFLLNPPAAAADRQECVVLLHGLARTPASLRILETRLETHGFNVVNFGYPSTSAPVEVLARTAVPDAVSQCGNATKLHFVTHSLGGILLRDYARNDGGGNRLPENLGRIVMLGPPNGGSELVDELSGLPGFAMWFGPAALQLGTGPESAPNRLGDADFPVGIIAGSRSAFALFSLIIPGPDDGRVSVARTRLGGMTDHIVLPVTHDSIIISRAVAEQAISFIETGRFRSVRATGQDIGR